MAEGTLLWCIVLLPVAAGLFSVFLPAARAVLGRGLAGRYWKLELASDTERAELDSIDFSFAAMSRRV